MDVANKIIQWSTSIKLPKISAGYVYIISSEDLITYKKCYKIGETSDVDRRLRQLHTGNPFLQVIYKQKFDNMHDIEELLHTRYRSNNIALEWFIIEDIDECIDYMKSP